MEFIKLYEVNPLIEKAIDYETGELLIPEEEFDALIQAEQDGIKYFVSLYKNALATQKAFEEEKKAQAELFDAKINACKRTAERAKSMLDKHLDGNKWEGTEGKISYRSSTTTEQVDLDAFLNWDGRFKYMDFKPNPHKDDIGKAIDAGEEIPGFSRVKHNNIQIK